MSGLVRLLPVVMWAMWVSTTPVRAGELLAGTVALEDGANVPFSLSGETLENVIGGTIRLGSASFEIARVSRMGLVGGTRVVAPGAGEPRGYAEFVIFSSSFSSQTATGQPWVASRSYVRCDDDYNSFLALYRVYAVERREALGEIPYSVLTESVDVTDESTVYCFMSSRAR